jgi:hypothetical protein
VIILRGSDDFLPSEGASWGTVTLFAINLAKVFNFLWDDYWVLTTNNWLNKVRFKGFFEETNIVSLFDFLCLFMYLFVL